MKTESLSPLEERRDEYVHTMASGRCDQYLDVLEANCHPSRDYISTRFSEVDEYRSGPEHQHSTSTCAWLTTGCIVVSAL
jgi:hypothetical protein